MLRVGTLGELTAAIAHEISQPLTAIASNARAARRLLEDPETNPTELVEILEDILADDLRAAAVSRRMRALLTAQETPRSAVRIEELILEVMKLLHSDVLLKNVKLELDLEEGLPPVWCDGIQVQQVVINLVLNGCEAMAELAAESRQLVIGTARESPEAIRVPVQDSGSGFGDAQPEDLFTPFKTTKPGGLGTGLSISRTIIDGHDGRIWGCEGPNGGATFHFTLPIASTAVRRPH